MLSQKDYVKAAAIIREHTEDAYDIREREQLAERFAAWFASDNPRFQRSMFYAACGMEKS